MSNVVAFDSKNVLSFSSFGDQTTHDMRNFRPRSILYGDRFRDLDARESHYTCTRHDSKIYDFDGRVIGGPKAMQPLISSEKSPIYIPLNMRRPSAPVRMGKIIVDSFTNLLFGENRFPNIKVTGDELTQDFIQAVVRVGRLPLAMIRARQLGGAMGTVGLSWCFHDGYPRFEVHNAKNLHVHSWLDRVLLRPRHVSEVYLFHDVKWDGKAFNKIYYWFRRDWTPDGDFVFKDVPFKQGEDPHWEIDEEKSNRHGDGIVHFEWIQNLPTDEIDGLPDYEGLYDQFDQLDILSSVVTRGAILNLDPTLKLKLDPDLVKRTGIRKGSDNALIVGETGDASYMELAGTSIDAGIKLLESLRRFILETAQCVVPDPHEVAAQGVSSVTIKALFAPMLSKADVLREQYVEPIKRALGNMAEVVRRKMAEPPQMMPVVDERGEPAVDEAGNPVEEPVQFVLHLPPRMERRPQQQPVIDPVTGMQQTEPAIDEATGQPMIDPATGLPQTVPTMETVEVDVPVPRLPGPGGGEVEAQWPPYFTPTFDDQSKLVTSMQVATGGTKAFMSGETAIDLVAAAFGIDPTQEKRRVGEDAQGSQQQTAAMFPPGAGGEVEAPNQLPPGASSRPTGPRGPVEPPPPAAPPEAPPFVPEPPPQE